MEYNHDWPSCSRTYATACVYLGQGDPDQVTSTFGVMPTRTQRLGQDLSASKRHPRLAKVSAWFLESQPSVASRDLRAHLDWLIEKLTVARPALRRMASEGVDMRVMVFWESAGGRGGGPAIDNRILVALGDLGFSIDLDIWVEE